MNMFTAWLLQVRVYWNSYWILTACMGAGTTWVIGPKSSPKRGHPQPCRNVMSCHPGCDWNPQKGWGSPRCSSFRIPQKLMSCHNSIGLGKKYQHGKFDKTPILEINKHLGNRLPTLPKTKTAKKPPENQRLECFWGQVRPFFEFLLLLASGRLPPIRSLHFRSNHFPTKKNHCHLLVRSPVHFPSLLSETGPMSR